MPLPRRARTWAWVLALLGAAMVLPLCYLAITGIIAESALAERGETTCAPVTEQRIMRRRPVTYELKYRFEADGVAFRHSDETGRDDLWATVSPQEWASAVDSGCLDVLYLPNRPAVNRPLRTERLNDPIGNKIAALFLAALICALFGAGIFSIVATARTRVWRLVSVGERVWQVASEAGERTVALAAVRGATLITLPKAKVHPPWRFSSDVLRLVLDDGEKVVASADATTMAAALTALEANGLLKRKRGH